MVQRYYPSGGGTPGGSSSGYIGHLACPFAFPALPSLLLCNESRYHMTQPKSKTEVFTATKSSTDQVKEDGVMKELFRKEEETRRNWEQKWGFMKNPKRLWIDEADRRGLPPGLFSGRDGRSLYGMSSWSEYKTENIRIQPSEKIPVRTSGMIGWRSSVKENDYNRLVGPLYVSARLTMNPPLSKDEPDPNNQKFLFLG